MHRPKSSTEDPAEVDMEEGRQDRLIATRVVALRSQTVLRNLIYLVVISPINFIINF